MPRKLLYLSLACIAVVAVAAGAALLTAPSAPPIGALIVAALVLHDVRSPDVGIFLETAIVDAGVLFGFALEAVIRPPSVDRLVLIGALLAIAGLLIFLEVRQRRAAGAETVTHPRPLTG